MMANYPTQLDEIDQWLVDNFDIIPGACSSTENLRYNTAKMIAEALWPKCKDSLHIQETCKENGDSFTDDIDNERDQVEGPSRDQVDELEKAAKENAKAIKTHWIKTICIENFISGANWQKEQLRDLCYQCEKNYDNVFFKGEQHAIKMLKEEAIERTVKVDAGGYPYIDETELYDYEKDEPTAKKGDKVKVLILKE